MKFEQLEKVLAQAAVDISFREQLVKGEVDVKSEFGLSDEEVKVLETLLAGEGAPGLQALLNVVVATPTMATPTPATLMPTMATPTPATLMPTMTTPTPATLMPTMTTLTPATTADVQRVTELVEKKLARLENLEAKLKK